MHEEGTFHLYCSIFAETIAMNKNVSAFHSKISSDLRYVPGKMTQDDLYGKNTLLKFLPTCHNSVKKHEDSRILHDNDV